MTLSSNGKWTLANAIITVGVAFLLALVGYMLREIDTLQSFRDQGDRFTSEDAMELEHRLISRIQNEFPPRWLTDLIEHEVANQSRINAEFDTELKRQQLQIDRLEGHAPKNYTEDEDHSGHGHP